MKRSTFLTLLMAVSLYAGPNKEVQALSKELRELLSSEMLQIEKGMHQIFSSQHLQNIDLKILRID